MIDTPESGEPFYEEASLYLANLILNKEVSLKPVGSGFDRYGRIIAEAFVDSTNVSQSILGSGLAVIYLFKNNAYLKDKYLPFQIEAMEKKIGVWSLPEPVPEKYYINLKGSYRFHRPLCSHLKKTDPNKFQIIKSREQALKMGLSPCRNCRP